MPVHRFIFGQPTGTAIILNCKSALALDLAPTGTRDGCGKRFDHLGSDHHIHRDAN